MVDRGSDVVGVSHGHGSWDESELPYLAPSVESRVVSVDVSANVRLGCRPRTKTANYHELQDITG